MQLFIATFIKDAYCANDNM